MIESILITGVGGQGVITLGKIIAASAMMDGYEVTGFADKGGAQRGGKASTFIRYFRQTDPYSVSARISSQLLNLVFSLDFFETARNLEYYSENTQIISNSDASIPALARNEKINSINKNDLIDKIKEKTEHLILKDFTAHSLDITGNIINTNLSLLAYIVKYNQIQINDDCIIQAVKNILGNEKYEIFESLFENQ